MAPVGRVAFGEPPEMYDPRNLLCRMTVVFWVGLSCRVRPVIFVTCVCVCMCPSQEQACVDYPEWFTERLAQEDLLWELGPTLLCVCAAVCILHS